LNIQVVKIPVKGLGVIAVSPIHKGEVTCNYNGDLISTHEADEREVPPHQL
jgi:SET domain-containing protein